MSGLLWYDEEGDYLELTREEDGLAEELADDEREDNYDGEEFGDEDECSTDRHLTVR